MRTNNGAIQISRSIYDSDIWYKPSDWFKIWIYIIGNVNFGDTNKFKRGENYFKYEIISIECNTTYKTVVNCIKFLKEGKQIETQKTTRGNIIKVINYDKYQDLCNYEKAYSKASGKAKVKASSNTIKEEGKEGKEGKEIIKHKYGEYKNVLLTDKQKNKLILDFGEKEYLLLLKKLDEGIQVHGYKYKDHNLVIRKWSKTEDKGKLTYEKEGEKNYLEGLFNKNKIVG